MPTDNFQLYAPDWVVSSDYAEHGVSESWKKWYQELCSMSMEDLQKKQLREKVRRMKTERDAKN